MHYLDDDRAILHAERVVKAKQERSGATNPIDDFTTHEKAKTLASPRTKFGRAFMKIRNSNFLVRYFCFITPLVLLLLIPLILGHFMFQNATVGGVKLFWFGIWLEIIWLTLWVAKILAKIIPWPIGLLSGLFTNNSKKWRDLGKALESPATLFFWWLAIEISFLPTMINHHLDDNTETYHWEITVNKIIISIFIGTCLNLFEKIIIQLVAISFHLRTYADRIQINKFQISSLVKLYLYSKEKIADSELEADQLSCKPFEVRTPVAYVNKAQKNARQVFNKVGEVAGRVAGDFTHPRQVILHLLSTTGGSQLLARRLHLTFSQLDSKNVLVDALRPAFDNNDEVEATFTMFDKDLNGDISMEEFESVCVEVGRERKAITASLKDLDSVVSKLDKVFLFIVFIITVLVLTSLMSTSASGVLTSAGSTILALSWLFSATAQEFLQSVIFVFVKHPFDVGDRVTIYGNTGSQLKGDDYYVKEIALLYTEFKKVEGQVVQAPNSHLNNLFILNQRRSGGLAETIPVTVKFCTTLDQIQSLRDRLLEFVGSEKREYKEEILTEVTNIYEAHSITLNVVFFYKSNWQNEHLRLQRRNKFVCAMMVTIKELGIEGPRMHLPGVTPAFPIHVHRENSNSSSFNQRAASVPSVGKKCDLSFGMQPISSGANLGDVYEDMIPKSIVTSPPRERDKRLPLSLSRQAEEGSLNTSTEGTKSE